MYFQLFSYYKIQTYEYVNAVNGLVFMMGLVQL